MNNTTIKSEKGNVEKIPLSLTKKVKWYKEMAAEVDRHLLKNPHDWGRFQSQFNQEINNVFRTILDFERESNGNDHGTKVYRLKRLFERKFRQLFLRGEYITWSLKKPYGYAGDFQIIDNIYQNNPPTLGFDRLFDNYFQMSAISVAVRNRKEDIKRFVVNAAQNKPGKPIRIMDLACGPSRDVKELLVGSKDDLSRLEFHCYDADPNALEYAKEMVKPATSVYFYQMNVLRIALKKDIQKQFDSTFDIIYSTGLFDYLNEQVSVRLISNLKKILSPGGLLFVSDVRDKFSNPSAYFMEWVGDWNLIYRSDDEFRSIFTQSGFKERDLSYGYEQQGIMQYVTAKQPEK